MKAPRRRSSTGSPRDCARTDEAQRFSRAAVRPRLAVTAVVVSDRRNINGRARRLVTRLPVLPRGVAMAITAAAPPASASASGTVAATLSVRAVGAASGLRRLASARPLRPLSFRARQTYRNRTGNRERRHHIRGIPVFRSRVLVSRLALLRAPMLLLDRLTASAMARAAAPRATVCLRAAVRLSVRLAEELPDGGVVVRRQAMHAVARFDDIGVGLGINRGNFLRSCGRVRLRSAIPIALVRPLRARALTLRLSARSIGQSRGQSRAGAVVLRSPVKLLPKT